MMEKLKKVSRAHWCLFALLIGFAFLMQNCSEDDALIYDENQTETELNAKPVSGKVNVCRYNERKDTYSVVSVVEKRVLEGDVILDADGDGYFKENLCGVVGLGIDCDDTNPAINPGVVEICDDGIDNNCNGEIDECTYVPDDNFEQVLNYKGIDNDGLNNYVLTANINTVTDLDISGSGIYDLTGIEGFTALERLDCRVNNLSILDLSQNFELITLYCPNNYLKSIDVSNSANLDHVNCESNLLESLNLSANTALTYLNCDGNQISDLNLIYNTNLVELYCSGNGLSNLNVRDNLYLQTLLCYNNQLTILDVSSNENLEYFYCDKNQLKSLDVSNNTALYTLVCRDNQLISLNVSNNTGLSYLDCRINALNCIQISESQNSDIWLKDSTATFSLLCPS